MGKTKALLIGINRYRKMEDYDNLASSNTNVKIVKMGLERCLKLSPENNKVCKGLHRNEINKGELIKFLNENISDMNDDDTLILYFTGHGDKGKIVLSDGSMTYQELMGIIEQKRIKNKVIILDCCYAGSFDIDKVDIEHNSDMQYLIEHGYALMASCSENEESFLYDGKFNGQKCKVSPFSFLLSVALISCPYVNYNFYNGNLPLDYINKRLGELINTYINLNEKIQLFDFEELCSIPDNLKKQKILPDGITIAEMEANKGRNIEYIYKTNIHGGVMFDVKNIMLKKQVVNWKKIKGIFSKEVQTINNEIIKVDISVQKFISAFEKYCNKEIEEDELIKILAPTNKELETFENELINDNQYMVSIRETELSYYQIRLRNLKKIASSLRYAYDPKWLWAVGDKNERRKSTQDRICYYNMELSKIREILVSMDKN